MRSKVLGIQRGTSSTEIELEAGRDGDLSASQFLPPYAALVATGAVFAFDMSAGVSKIPVTSMPTTSPEWGIYNAHDTKWLVLIKVSFISESGTMGLGAGVVCAAAIGDQTAINSNYSSAIVSCLDGSTNVPLAYITNNPTLLGGTPAWVPFAVKDQVAVISVGTGVVAHVGGMIMAPPKGMVCAEIVAPTGATSKFDVSFVVALMNIDRP